MAPSLVCARQRPIPGFRHSYPPWPPVPPRMLNRHRVLGTRHVRWIGSTADHRNAPLHPHQSPGQLPLRCETVPAAGSASRRSIRLFLLLMSRLSLLVWNATPFVLTTQSTTNLRRVRLFLGAVAGRNRGKRGFSPFLPPLTTPAWFSPQASQAPPGGLRPCPRARWSSRCPMPLTVFSSPALAATRPSCRAPLAR